MSETEESVRRHVVRVAPALKGSENTLDLESPLRQEYGVSSMKMIMLITSLCKEMGVGLTSFDERQLAGIRTGRDLVRLFDEVKGGGTA